ncbi:exopolysaccharide biosynthesis polyprenyl glycosylphosphotransferase [bacterium]|nr:exopolysaccharide biosynthesis polyprenyl glycosylphosphotransferase [bacterium]
MTTSAPSVDSIWKSRWLSLFLIGVDVVGYSLSWMGAWYMRGALEETFGSPINDQGPYQTVHLLVVMVAILNAFAFGLYIHRRRLSSLNHPALLMKASYHWLLYIVVVAFFFKELDLGRSVIVMAAAFGTVYLFTSRSLLRWAKRRSLEKGVGTVRCAILGTSQLAIEVKESLRNHPEVGFSLVGLIKLSDEATTDEEQRLLDANGVRLLGKRDDIASIIAEHRVEELFLAVADLAPQEQFKLLNMAEVRGVSVHVVSNIFGVILESAKVDEISTFPVVTLRDGHLPFHQTMMKRALDLALSLVGVVVWLLFFHWWIAILVRRGSPGPVFFSQERVGRDGRVFNILKYRTMHTEAKRYDIAPTSEEDPRVTPAGRWLRRTSLDELPQLLNVLKGDMSLVGPRPEMPFLVDQYEPWQRRRLDVKPGLTGLWQVIGRKNLPLHLNMQYDFYYIKNQSFLLDLEILFRTIPAVLKGKGAF